MMLSELIEALEAVPDQGRVLPVGFGDPASYRGDYRDLMFEPMADVTVASMLEAARSALGATYEGWKGGDYTMTGYTDCWLAWPGHGDGETIGPVMLALMLAAPALPDDARGELRRLTVE